MESKISLKGLWPIYLNKILKNIGSSLFSIFIPIYLLTLKYSFQSVLIYYITFFTIIFILAPISLLLSKKIGYKPIMITNEILTIIFLLGLINLAKLNISIYLIATIGGIKEVFYQLPLHAFFVRLSDKIKRGSQFSNYLAIGQILGLVGPLIGGLIAYIFGFSSLFYFIIFFVIIATIPLFLLENIKPNIKLSFSGIYNLTNSHKKFFFGTISQNIMNDAEVIIWPIFIFFGLKNLISVGSVGTLVGLGTVIFTLFVGKFSDKKNKYILLKLGGLIYAIVWISRIYINHPIFLYTISLIAGFLMVMIEVPFQVVFYSKAAEERDIDEFVIFREIPIYLGRMILLVFMLIFINKFLTAFVLSALACLFFVFFRFEKKNK